MITIVRNGEGFGSLYQCMMSGIAYCDFYNKEFIYTRVRNVGHNVDPKEFEKMTGLDVSLNKNFKDKPKIYEFMKEVHFAQKPSIFYTKETRDKIRKLYYKNPKPKDCPFDIAIHIRRGDVVERKQNNRFITNDNYRKIILDLQKEYPEFTIGVYSEGKLDDFKQISDLNIKIILNGNPLHTFHQLVTAKILVTAKSSFSISAGILSKGKVYYIPAKHKPLDDWIILDFKSPDKI